MLSSSWSGCEEGARSKVTRDEGPVFRRLGGGARCSMSVLVMSTLGREEGTVVLSRSSLSDSTDGGSDKSDDGGESAILLKRK